MRTGVVRKTHRRMTHHTLIGKHSCMLQFSDTYGVERPGCIPLPPVHRAMAYVFSTLSHRDSDGDTGPFCWWTVRYPPWAFVDRGARKRMFPVTRDVVDRQRKKTRGAADRGSRLHFGFPTLKAYYKIMSRWAHQFAGNPCGCGGGPTVHHQPFSVYSYPSRRP